MNDVTMKVPIMGSRPAPDPMAENPSSFGHELRKIEQCGEEDGRGEQRRHSGSNKSPILQDSLRNQCAVAGAPLDHQKRDHRRGCEHEQEHYEGSGPAHAESPVEPEQQCEESDGQRRRPA